MGLVCASEAGAANMRRALEAAGIRHITLEHAGMDNKQALDEMLGRVDWAVGSRVIIETLRAIAPPGVQVMKSSHVLDQAGVEMLKQYLEKKRKTL